MEGSEVGEQVEGGGDGGSAHIAARENPKHPQQTADALRAAPKTTEQGVQSSLLKTNLSCLCDLFKSCIGSTMFLSLMSPWFTCLLYCVLASSLWAFLPWSCISFLCTSEAAM